MKPWMVVCCGCLRGLGPNGELLGGSNDGLLQFADLARCEFFETKEAADKAALSFGWTVRDDSGPNHRCPHCHSNYVASLRDWSEDRRGAYVDVRELQRLGSIRLWK